MAETPRPSPSPFSSANVLTGTIRILTRRYRVGRIVATVILIVVVATMLHRSDAAVTAARDSWGVGPTVWVTTAPIEAGGIITAESIAEQSPPAGMVPAEAATTNPEGERSRVALVAGEIIIESRLSGASSSAAASVPPGWVGINLGLVDELFSTGDVVDLHDVIDGSVLARRALVLASGEDAHELAVAVPPESTSSVVRALGQAGIVPVLRG